MEFPSVFVDGVLHREIVISGQSERVRFDLILPEWIVTLTGILAYADPGPLNRAAFQASNWPNQNAGFFNLRWHRPGDIFYQSHAAMPMEFGYDYQPMNMQTYDNGFFNSHDFGISGTRITPMKIHLENCHLIEGYYKDILNEVGGNSENYTLHIYIYYKKSKRCNYD